MDKNTAEMSAKERRKVKRDEKRTRLAERKILLEKLGNPPLEGRKSIFDRVYPETQELDWDYYEGLGWVCTRYDHSDFKINFAKCKVSGKWGRTEDMFRTPDGGYISPEVFHDKYFLCDQSGFAYPKEEAVKVYSGNRREVFIHKNLVDRLAVTCTFSGELWLRNSTTLVRGSEKYTVVAKRFVNGKDFTTCRTCNSVYPSNIVPYRLDIDRHECVQCYEVRMMGEIIHAHNYNRYPKPLYTKRTTRRMVGGTPQKDQGGWTYYTGKRECKLVDDSAIRLFGVEAETEISRKGAEKNGLNRYKLAMNVVRTLGDDFVIIKEDGTLTANEHYSKRTGYAGFEIVSAPADLDVHRERWNRLHQVAGFDHFRAWDEYDTCGFHVHVSRDSLTYLQIGRILMFINHKDNAKFIHRVAGRGSDRFCKYIPKEPGDTTHPATDVLYPSERVISKQEEDRRNRSRRVAVNLSNEKTIEFRIFRGTMHPRHIIRNIEFVDAVCDFCYPGNYSIKDMADYTVFIAFVNKNRKRYPLFAEWLANQKIIELKAIGAAMRKKIDLSKRTLKPEECAEPEHGKKQATSPAIVPVSSDHF